MAEEANQEQAPQATNQMPQLDPNLVNPLDETNKTKEDTALLKNIVSTTTGANDGRILEEAPELDSSILKGVEPPQSLLLVVLKLVFGVALSLSVASFLFFSSQLSNYLDPILDRFAWSNVSNDLAASNQEIVKLQTNLNLYRYLQAKSFLDNFSYVADKYMQDFEIASNTTVPESERDTAEAGLASLQEDMVLYLEAAKEKLQPSTHVQIIDDGMESTADLQNLFNTSLKDEIKSKAGEFVNKEDEEARMSYKNYIQTLNMVGNSDLRSLVVASDLKEMDSGETYEFVKDLSDLVVNDMSVIQDIKEKRVKWSDMMNEIILRTTAVDNYYSDDFYDELGGIRYTSYDFDAVERQITIVGETKRFDSRNFSMIADLIDELNQSRIFENGEMRSFSKSGSFDAGYTATLKLTLDIEDIDFSDPEITLEIN